MGQPSRPLRLPLEEAKRLRDQAAHALRAAWNKDIRAAQVNERLNAAEVRDHFREAVERELRGGHHG